MAATESSKMGSVTVESISPSSTSSGSSVSERDTPARRVEDKEALQYWGFLVKADKCGTEKLNRLLVGIAHYIVHLAFLLTWESYVDKIFLGNEHRTQI